MGVYEIDLSGRSFEIEAPTPEAAVRAAKKFVRDEDDNAALNAARSFFGQGLAFGFGDEIEAGARSLVGGGDYNDIVADIRDENAEYRRDNPVAAYGSELAGAAAPALIAALATGATGGAAAPAAAATGARLGSSGARLAAAIAANAGQGALAGAGYAEGDLADRARGAAMGGAIGGVVGAGAQMLPKLTPQAAKMIDDGMTLTPGQAVGGVIDTIEKASTSLPVVGGFIRNARMRANNQYFPKAASRALKFVGKELDEGLDTQGMVQAVEEGVRGAYDDIARKIQVDGAGAQAFGKAAFNALDEADENVVAMFGRTVNKAMSELKSSKSTELRKMFKAVVSGQKPKVKPVDLSGDEIMRVVNVFRKQARSARSAGNWQLANAYERMGSEFIDGAATFSRVKVGPALAKARLAFREMKILQAPLSNSADITQAPTIAQLAKSRQANMRKFGDANMTGQLLDEQAMANTIRNDLPNSGTADRAGIMGLLGTLGGVTVGAANPSLLAPVLPVGALGGMYATPATTAALRSATLAPGRIGTAMGGRFGALTQRNDEYGQ